MSGTARDMRARLVLSLRDGGVGAGLDRIGSRFDRIQATLRRLAAVSAIGLGLSWLGPMQQAAQFDDTLRQTAITAGRSGAEVEAYIRRTQAAYEGLAVRVGQRSRDIAAAAASLVASGMREDLVLPAMELIARVATASGSSMEELGRTYFQLQEQLGITTAQMPQAFAVLITGAKEGNFELRDMAREFPAILAAARALRIEGLGGAASLTAMLQVARTAAGSSSEAANNVLNALQKMASPETVRQFREIGVNIEALMNDAVRRGINPVEAVVQRLRERTGGNLFRLQELFGDRQALMGLLPMLQRAGYYLQTRDNAARASPDIIDVDAASRLRGALAQMTQLEERVEQLGRRFTVGLAPAIGVVNVALEGLQSGLAWLDGRVPGLVDDITSLGGGFLLTAAALGIIGQAISFVVGGIAAIVGVVGGIAAAIIAGIALIGAGAYLLWRHWDTVSMRTRETWAALRQVFTRFVSWLTGWAPAAYGGAVQIITGAWSVLSTWFNTLWRTWVVQPFEWFVGWVDGWTGGAATATINRIKAAWEGLKSFFSDLWDGIVRRFEEIWGRIQPVLERIERFFQRDQAGELSNPEGQAQRRQNWRERGRNGAAGYYPPEAAMPGGGPGGEMRVGGEIIVRAAPGTEVEAARTTTGPVTLTTPDRGATRSRP